MTGRTKEMAALFDERMERLRRLEHLRAEWERRATIERVEALRRTA